MSSSLNRDSTISYNWPNFRIASKDSPSKLNEIIGGNLFGRIVIDVNKSQLPANHAGTELVFLKSSIATLQKLSFNK